MEAGNSIWDVTPAELHLLARPDLGGPAFFVRDGLLQEQQQDLGQRVVAEAQALQQKGRLRAAGMSRGAGRWEDSSYRGDEMAWLAPGAAEEVVEEVAGGEDVSGGSGIPTLRIPKASAIHAAVARLERLARQLDALDRRGPGPPQLNLEAGLRKSVQLAYYPGDGRRYVRHRDAFPSAPEGEGEAIRCLTVICYLNADWQPEHGGHLRLFLPGGLGESEPEPAAAQWEMDPLLGRVVVFRSDVVEHEVLPAWGPRFALTCWFYGRPLHSIPPPVAAAAEGSSIKPLGALVAAFAAGVNNGGEKDPAAAASGAPGTAETDGVRTTTLPPLQIDEDEEGEEVWGAQTIFVSVAAYRDSECQHTLHSLFATARHPERVSVGLVWQGDASDETRCFARPLDPRWAKRVRTLRMDHREAAGPCWARHLAQALWQGERFLLQIDSHMRFRPNWDAYLVAALTRGGLPDEGRRAVLTTYPIGYELLPPGSDPGAGTGLGGARVPTDVRPTLLCPSKVRSDRACRCY
jgi:hypothetical protein